MAVEPVRQELGLLEPVRRELGLLELGLLEPVRRELELQEQASPVEGHDDEVEVEDDLSRLLLHLLRLQYLVPPI